MFLSRVASIFSMYHCLFKKLIFLIYFCLCWVFTAMLSFSLVVVSEGCSLVLEYRLRRHRLQYVQLTDSRALGQYLWCTGLVAQWHMGSSQTRDQTHVPSIGRQILNHWATEEVPITVFL